MIDLSESRYPPFQHQIQGVERLVTKNYTLLADEMGLGKTKQVIDAACVLFKQKLIRKVLVVCPSAVKPVWYDPAFGEIQKHHWASIIAKVGLYGSVRESWATRKERGEEPLLWIITNYEYIRNSGHLAKLVKWVDKYTWLVLDESTYVKTPGTQQSKSCFILRRFVERVVLLNGTPVTQSPLDLFTQGNLLHEDILMCKYKTHFISRYASTRDFRPVDWPGLGQLRKIFKPHVLRRLKKDCLDLPPKLPPVSLTVPLSENTWKLYKEMRDLMVVELETAEKSVARQTVVKLVRLAQITSGFIGGVNKTELRKISDEKEQAFLQWYKTALMENPKLKLLVWCRFVEEVDVIAYRIQEKFEGVEIGRIRGSQKKGDRERALRLLDPRSSPDAPVTVVGTPQTGKVGLNLTAATVVVYLSHDYSLFTRIQSEDRVHRPGQVSPVSYFDVIATGPNGQQTIDHIVIKSIRNRNEIANWTVGHWVTALRDSKDRPSFIPQIRRG